MAQGEAVAVRTRASRTRRRFVVLATALVGALVVTWVLVATHPRLTWTGASYQDPSFVQEEVPAGEDAQWIATDRPDGAWVATLLVNAAPYPITVTAVDTGEPVVVAVARYDDWPTVVDLGPDSVTPVDRVRVPAHGAVDVLMHLTDRCQTTDQHIWGGTDVATIRVTSLGLTTTRTVALPGHYAIHRTTQHTPDPDCPAGS